MVVIVLCDYYCNCYCLNDIIFRQFPYCCTADYSTVGPRSRSFNGDVRIVHTLVRNREIQSTSHMYDASSSNPSSSRSSPVNPFPVCYHLDATDAITNC
jgi:hypothetical protein